MNERERPTVAYVASTSIYLAKLAHPLLSRMARDGWRVLAIAPTDSFSSCLAGGAIEHVPLDLAREVGPALAHLRSLGALYRLYCRERPAIVHHFTANPVIYGTLAARAARVPRIVNSISGIGTVFESRRWEDVVPRSWLRAGYRFAMQASRGSAVFQNADHREWFVGRGLVRPERAVVIRGLGVDLDRFSPTPEPEGDPVLLFCGRMLWSKGVGDLIAAARALNERGMRFRLLLAGPADPTHRRAVPVSELESWQSSGLATWLGMREDMPSIFARSNVVVLPSRAEGISNVLMEAAASARAAVASDIPGCREVVRHGRTGFLVPPRDVAALSDALARLIESAELRASMGRRARELALAELGRERSIAEVTALYESLGEPAGRAAA